MQDLRPVTLYKCQHCKKYFKTANRHDCRRDPDKTNCYTCKHWGYQFYFDRSFSEDAEDMTCEPDEACMRHETSYVDDAYNIMCRNGWYLDCPEYGRNEKDE